MFDEGAHVIKNDFGNDNKRYKSCTLDELYAPYITLKTIYKQQLSCDKTEMIHAIECLM